MLTTAPQHVMYFSPAAESEMDMEGNLDLQYPTSPPPRGLHPSAVAPAFGAHGPFPRLQRLQGSSTPPGLTDEDFGSESGKNEAADHSDGNDGDFLPNQTSRSRTTHQQREQW